MGLMMPSAPFLRGATSTCPTLVTSYKQLSVGVLSSGLTDHIHGDLALSSAAEDQWRISIVSLQSKLWDLQCFHRVALVTENLEQFNSMLHGFCMIYHRRGREFVVAQLRFLLMLVHHTSEQHSEDSIFDSWVHAFRR